MRKSGDLGDRGWWYKGLLLNHDVALCPGHSYYSRGFAANFDRGISGLFILSDLHLTFLVTIVGISSGTSVLQTGHPNVAFDGFRATQRRVVWL